MKTKQIKSSDFDLDGFIDAIASFIEDNFGSNSPAETLRYFYSFEQPDTNAKTKPFTKKVADDWELEEFKNAILQGGETIFFPFSSGPDMDGWVNLANDEIVKLSERSEVTLGLTDCFGILVSLEKGKFVFRSAAAYGDMASSIEEVSHRKVDREMGRFLKSFTKR